MPRTKILVVDNYDSFVYNLVQYLAQIGAALEQRVPDVLCVRARQVQLVAELTDEADPQPE